MVTLRPYRPDDAPALLALCRDTIRRVNSRDYSPAATAGMGVRRHHSTRSPGLGGSRGDSLRWPRRVVTWSGSRTGGGRAHRSHVRVG